MEDKARYKVACLPRRSGKTTVCSIDLIRSALSRPGIVCLYITLARSNAKKLIWPMLQNACREMGISWTPNETELSITFSNGSVIYCSGAKDRTEIEKFRGLALYLVYIDEAQSFKSYIQDLLDDVLAPALRDYNGTVVLIGTPGPVPTGFFYKCTTSQAWSNHFWNGSANTFLLQKSGKTFEEQLADELNRMGVTIDHPTIQREWFGRWVIDTDKTVFKYNIAHNDYNLLPDGKWNYIISADIGYDDSDAIAVLGWLEHSNKVYVVEEFVKSKQGITELAHELTRVYKKYDPMKMVMDAGGLGKKIAEELNSRHSLPIVAAEKSRKFEYIEILNDALRRKELFAKSSGHFAQDSMLVEWEIPLVKLKDTYHSDITDAVLYGYRECLAWLEEPLKAKPTKDELIALEEQRMLESMIKSQESEDQYDMWDDRTFGRDM